MRSTQPSDSRALPNPSILEWLIDDYIESYVRWREECEGARCAYELWRQSEPRDRTLAFAAYGGALDREEHAAEALAQRTDDISRRLAAKPPADTCQE